MDLAFGTHVREHFYDIGRLTGLETDQLTHAVRSIVVSPEAVSDARSVRRPFRAVLADHFGGEIELRAFPEAESVPRGNHVVTLTGNTRLTRDGHEIGRLVAVEINPSSGEIVGVTGRHHWWMPRVHLGASALDFSQPGEIQVH
jgi:hypothetical protein